MVSLVSQFRISIYWKEGRGHLLRGPHLPASHWWEVLRRQEDEADLPQVRVFMLVKFDHEWWFQVDVSFSSSICLAERTTHDQAYWNVMDVIMFMVASNRCQICAGFRCWHNNIQHQFYFEGSKLILCQYVRGINRQMEVDPFLISCLTFLPSSLEEINSLAEVRALRRLSPHPNIIALKEVIL